MLSLTLRNNTYDLPQFKALAIVEENSREVESGLHPLMIALKNRNML